MGLLIGFIVLIVIGFIGNHDCSDVADIVGQVLGVLFFYWIGSLFASPSEVLSWDFSLATIAAGFFYCIAGIIAVLRVLACFH